MIFFNVLLKFYHNELAIEKIAASGALFQTFNRIKFALELYFF